MNKIPSEKEILDALPDAVIWACPVLEGKIIVDFEVKYCNQQADEAIRHADGCLTGKRILADGIPERGKQAETNFRHYLETFLGKDDTSHSFHVPNTNRVFEMKRKRFHGGVLSISSNRTAQWEAERKEREHAELLQKIVDNAPAGILLYEAIRDATGSIVDFQCRLYNEEAHHLTGFSAAERSNMTLNQILEDNQAEANFARYKETVDTGEPFSFLFLYKKTQRWLHFFGVRFGDGFITILTDNTEKIANEEALQKHSQYLDSILNSSQNAINTMRAIRDEKGEVVDFCYTQINKAFEKITRVLKEDVVNRTMKELFPNSFNTGVFDAYREALRTGIPSRQQLRYVGEHLNAWYDLSLVRLDEETLVGTFSDISEIKEVQLQLEISRDRLSRFINTAQTGLGLFQPIFDEKGKVVDFSYGICNTSFAQYSGKSPEELEGLPVSTIFPTYMVNGNFEVYRRVYLSGEQTRFESHFAGDGIDLWFDTTARKMEEGVLLTVNDISEVKRLQFQLEKSVEELKRSNANLEAFAYAASHDLKEPIRKITFFTDFIQNDRESVFSADTKRIFGRLLAAGHRMNSLIEDLLSYSRISFQSTTEEQVDLNEIIRLVLQDLDQMLEEKGGRVTSDRLPMVPGQSRQLQQLFQNLIANALKYSRPGVAPDINIIFKEEIPKETLPVFFTDQPWNYILVTISDNGIGFRQEDAERIFNVFQRLHGSSEFNGNGIGLAIARKVVENHHGFIWAEGTLNEGASFNILLPRNPQHSKPERNGPA